MKFVLTATIFLFASLLIAPSTFAAGPSCFEIFKLAEPPFRIPSEDAIDILAADFEFKRAVLISSENYNVLRFYGNEGIAPATAVNVLQILNTMAGRRPLVELDVKAVELVREFPPEKIYYSRNLSTVGGMLRSLVDKWLPGLSVKVFYDSLTPLTQLQVESNNVKVVVIQSADGIFRPLILKGRKENQLIFMDPEFPQDSLMMPIEAISVQGTYTLTLDSST